MKKSRTAYIETDCEGKPCTNLAELTQDIWNQAGFQLLSGSPTLPCGAGLTNRPAKGRRKVRITVTVEVVK